MFGLLQSLFPKGGFGEVLAGVKKPLSLINGTISFRGENMPSIPGRLPLESQGTSSVLGMPPSLFLIVGSLLHHIRYRFVVPRCLGGEGGVQEGFVRGLREQVNGLDAAVSWTTEECY